MSKCFATRATFSTHLKSTLKPVKTVNFVMLSLTDAHLIPTIKLLTDTQALFALSTMNVKAKFAHLMVYAQYHNTRLHSLKLRIFVLMTLTVMSATFAPILFYSSLLTNHSQLHPPPSLMNH